MFVIIWPSGENMCLELTKNKRPVLSLPTGVELCPFLLKFFDPFSKQRRAFTSHG
jgi:hypothetical protein